MTGSDVIYLIDEARCHSHFNEVMIPALLSKVWHRTERLTQVTSTRGYHYNEQS